MEKRKLVRITTVPISLNLLIRGQMKYMKEHGWEVLTASADGPEVEELTAREGIPHTLMPLTRKITPLTDLKALWKMILWLRKVKPHIVHTHTPKAGLIGMLAARITGVPHRLHTVAGMPLMETHGFKRFVLEYAESLTYACATRIYPNSLSLKKIIQKEFDISNKKLFVIGKGSSNGIDTTYFNLTPDILKSAEVIRSKYGLTYADPIFCFVGRIVKDKGINELISAFKKVQSDFPRAGLLLIGAFEQQLNPLSDSTLKEIETNNSIITTGFQKDIRPFLAVSEIFVFPSYREGFPNVVLQAACMNLPSIVSDINGCNEIIRHNENGFIVPLKNVEELAGAMRKLAGDMSLRMRLAENARESVVNDYEQSTIWENLLHEYSTLK